MKNFRKLPIEVAAVQFKDRNLAELQEFTGWRPQSDHNPDVKIHTVNPLGTYLPDYLHMGAWGELWVATQDRWVALYDTNWVVKTRGVLGFTKWTNQDFVREHADPGVFGFEADDPQVIDQIDGTAEDARMLGRVRMALIMTRPMSEVDAICDRLMHIVAMYRVREEQDRKPLTGPIGIVAEPLRYDEDTMVKVLDAINTGLAAWNIVPTEVASDIISELQNAGIKFREVDQS